MIEVDQGSGRLLYDTQAEGYVFDNEVSYAALAKSASGHKQCEAV